jgi:hypothetical protein
VLFDDADKRFQFKELFTDITGDLNVNPKNQNSYLIPYHLSPKFCISTNYAPFGLDSSSTSRLLYMSFGNWYHGKIEDFEERSPMHDFDKRFFTDWDDEQWNLFLNFAMQCLQFYLSTNEKIGAPEGNIRKRNLQTEIGVTFLDWADEFFKDENINQAVCRREMLDNLKNSHSSMRQISPTSFKHKLKQYCELRGYIFNPKEQLTDKAGKRIMKWAGGKTEEHFYIQVPKESTEENEPDELFF